MNELQSRIDPDEIDRIHQPLAPIFEADAPVTYLYPDVQTSVATMRTTSSRIVRVSLLGLVGVMTACAAEGPSDSGEPTTLTVLYCCGEMLLTPDYNLPAQQIVFLPLTDLDDEGEPTGNLARSWEHTPDYRSWMIHLRTDVRWHDGVPVTAHDIKFTLDLLSDPDVGMMAGTAISSVVALDDSTVAVEIQASGINLLDGYTVFYPRHLLEDLDPAQISTWDFWDAPVGNGPYRYVRRVPQLMMEFEANPDYYRGRPAIDRLIVRFGDPSLTELLGGEVDAVPWVDRSEDWTQIEGDGRFLAVNVVYYSGGAMGLYLNHDHVLFSDARVRRAVALAIDRREILRALALPADIALFDVPVTPRQGRRRDFPASLPYDPGRATEILEEVGWRDSDGDGVRERNGIPARFELITRSLPRAVLVREHLRRVGLDAEILNLEPGVVEERVDLSAFDAVIHVVQDNTDWLLHHFGRDAATGYSNPRVAELLEVAAASSLDDSVDATYAAVGEVFQRDLPLIYLQPWITTQFVHRRIKGPRMPLTGNLLRQLEQLWIEEL